MALGPLLLATLALNPQQSAFFPFVIPWDDAVKGTVTDVSFLNTKPAGKNGWILSRNGTLVEKKTGKRVKFLGTNFTARAAFPSHQDADKVAARLAKLGMNIVRFHHLQNSWDKEKGMIWKQGKEMIELDPKQLDRLDYLVAALKRHGIYANINLQTTRDYLPEMGFPASVKSLPWGFAKRIDKFNPKMIAYQKEYARQLIGRRNKYTGLKYTEDPAVMVVEINNENSLVGAPWEALGGGFDTVPEPFKTELRTLWNQWLAKKYGNNQELEKAWSASKTPKGPNMLTPSMPWSFEHQGDTRMDATPTNNVGFDANITNNTGPVWALQANITGLTMNNGDTYTVTFRGKADRKRPVTLQGTIDQPDWHGIGLNQRIDLDTEWRDYKAIFTVSGAEPGHNRVGFTLGDSIGRVNIANFSVSPGTDPFKLATGHSLGTSTVDLPSGGGTAAQAADFMDFLTETEAAYSLQMRDFLKKDLGYKGIVYDTQISWGGLTGLVREAPMEVADNHSYYHHPEFPGTGWDEVNWIVRNSPMVNDLGPGYSELGGLAQYRVKGKPYSISEYNHPAPMDYRAEMMPLISSFAAVQDWDIIYSF
ncbi:MAG TPA: carbohydrate binding domain-containing protein, partial [Fimbriimonas sp.]|nr:carbohydrate binding domain-containing protein [Fimbriimonas sp.]